MKQHDEKLIWEAYVNEAVDPQLIAKIVNKVGADVIRANKGSYDAVKGVIDNKYGKDTQPDDVIIAVMMRADASVDEAYVNEQGPQYSGANMSSPGYRNPAELFASSPEQVLHGHGVKARCP